MSSLDKQIEELVINGYGVFTPKDNQAIKALIQEQVRRARIDIIDRVIDDYNANHEVSLVQDLTLYRMKLAAQNKAGDESDTNLVSEGDSDE